MGFSCPSPLSLMAQITIYLVLESLRPKAPLTYWMLVSSACACEQPARCLAHSRNSARVCKEQSLWLKSLGGLHWRGALSEVLEVGLRWAEWHNRIDMRSLLLVWVLQEASWETAALQPLDPSVFSATTELRDTERPWRPRELYLLQNRQEHTGPFRNPCPHLHGPHCISYSAASLSFSPDPHFSHPVGSIPRVLSRYKALWMLIMGKERSMLVSFCGTLAGSYAQGWLQ